MENKPEFEHNFRSLKSSRKFLLFSASSVGAKLAKRSFRLGYVPASFHLVVTKTTMTSVRWCKTEHDERLPQGATYGNSVPLPPVERSDERWSDEGAGRFLRGTRGGTKGSGWKPDKLFCDKYSLKQWWKTDFRPHGSNNRPPPNCQRCASWWRKKTRLRAHGNKMLFEPVYCRFFMLQHFPQ